MGLFTLGLVYGFNVRFGEKNREAVVVKNMVVAGAAFTVLRLRHVQTPWLGVGVRRLCTRTRWTNPRIHPDGYYHSETEARGMFQVWCKVYRRTYPSEEEKLFRYGCFREALEFSTRRNHDFSPGGQCFGPNCFADRSEEELPRGRVVTDEIWQKFLARKSLRDAKSAATAK